MNEEKNSLDWEKILEEKGLWDIDKELDEDWNSRFYLETKKSIDWLLDLNLNEKFSDYYFKLYSWNDLVWIIEYTNNEKWEIHIDFFASINWDLNSVITDNEFIEKFNSYFWNNSDYIKGIWKKTFINFLNKFNSDTIFSFISLEWAEWFYDKILSELEVDWKISIIWKIPEYKFILL